MREMQFDFDGLIQLLAGHLYSEKQVFLRELIQNAQDSIRRRQARDPVAPMGRIQILANPADLVFEIQDNGDGMTDTDLNEFLSTIGRSGTRLQKKEIAGLVGQFGIGFLAAFLVGKRVEVVTRRYDSSQGWSWVNEGRKDYELAPCPVERVGTTVRVFLKGPEERGVLYEEELRMLIKKYAEMLPTSIYLNELPEPVNLQVMPWEQTGLTESERRHACHLYLEEKMPDRILEVIPFHLTNGVKASGVLYLTKTRTVGIEIPRSVRLYLRRMFLCDNTPDLLPKWATFVNGIIDAEDLTPTAARDNYIRDAVADQLRAALGDIVIKHIESLHAKDPERFRQIQHYHAIGIKAACDFHEDLYAKLAHLLLWRTNWRGEDREPGCAHAWKTLPEILAALPNCEGESQALACFTDRNSANQYFQMADAAGTLVVDASYLFEDRLLKAYTRLPGVHVRLIHVDREEDPTLFRPVSAQDGAQVRRLADTMAALIQPGGQRLRVEACRFNPPELTAVLRTTERSEAASKARGILEDPNLPSDLKHMTEELLRLSKDAPLKLVINASNPLVKRLASQDCSQPLMGTLLIGLYHSALVHNAQMLTPTTARQLHEHMERLMGHALTLLEMVKTVKPQLGPHTGCADSQELMGRRHSHGVMVFLAPGGARYRVMEEALREVVEDRFGYQLMVFAGQGTEEPDGSRLLNQAQGILADMSEPNATVLLKLGMVMVNHGGRPIVLLQERGSSSIRSLPVECSRYSCVEYDLASGGSLAERLRTQLESEWATVLSCGEHDPYVSPRALRQRVQMDLPDSMYVVLSKTFPSAQAWRKATPREVAEVLRDYGSLAEILLTKMQDAGVSVGVAEA